MGSPIGTPVVAAFDGRAITYWDDDLGTVVALEGVAVNGMPSWIARLLRTKTDVRVVAEYRVRYCHLSEVWGAYPRDVDAGAMLGWTGWTGAERGTAPHLHVEVSVRMPDGRCLLDDPGAYFPATQRGTSPRLDPVTREPA